jgi:thiol:disulfide interchange protein DsbA
MMLRSLTLIALLSFSVVACGREAAKPPGTSMSPGAAAASIAPPTATEPKRAVEETSGEAARAQETGAAEQTTDSKADTALERLAALTPEQQLPAGKWKVGTNYVPLVPAQPTSVTPGKVEVVEVFWYGCPHCYALEAYVASWEKSKASYIDFVRVPVMWGPVHKAHARLYYTLEALNRKDLHKDVFDTIHRQVDDPDHMLVSNDDARTLAMDVAWAKKHGIDEATFTKAWNSFSVNSSLQRAEELTRRYKVEGVPLMVINGKYTTDVGRAGGQTELISLINDLTASEKHR